MLSLKSQGFFAKFALVLFCYITNHLMTDPLGNSEFCFPRISMFPSTSLPTMQPLDNFISFHFILFLPKITYFTVGLARG